MKTCGGVEGRIAPLFFALALDGTEWSVSRPGRFTPGERTPSILYIGGWMDPQSVQTRQLRDKFLVPAGNRTPAVQHVKNKKNNTWKYVID
jgi:hypothetical protein